MANPYSTDGSLIRLVAGDEPLGEGDSSSSDGDMDLAQACHGKPSTVGGLTNDGAKNGEWMVNSWLIVVVNGR